MFILVKHIPISSKISKNTVYGHTYIEIYTSRYTQTAVNSVVFPALTQTRCTHMRGRGGWLAKRVRSPEARTSWVVYRLQQLHWTERNPAEEKEARDKGGTAGRWERVAEQKWEEGKNEQCPRRERETAGICIGKSGEDRRIKMKMKTGSAFWSSHMFTCVRRKEEIGSHLIFLIPFGIMVSYHELLYKRKRREISSRMWLLLI